MKKAAFITFMCLGIFAIYFGRNVLAEKRKRSCESSA